MADDEDVLAFGDLAKELLEIFYGGGGGECFGLLNRSLVTGFGADHGGGLKGALEWARDDEIKLYVQCIEHVSKLETVLFPFLVEGTLYVEEGICSAKASASVAKNIQIHNLFTYYRRPVCGSQPGVNVWCDVGLWWWFGRIVMEDSGVWHVK
jgi:hypothetical protein